LPDLHALAAEWGYEIVTTYDVTASATSGAINAHRDQMMRDAESEGFDALIVWKIDRLSRYGGDDSLALVRQLHRWGVWVHFAHERIHIDPAQPIEQADRFRLFLGGDFGEQETADRRARVRIGHARARAQGKHLGRFKGSKDKCKACGLPKGDEHRGSDHRFKGRPSDGYRLRWARERVARMESRQNKAPG
jgi:DNA invertase Pin-like site-specific DNA recombinase